MIPLEAVLRGIPRYEYRTPQLDAAINRWLACLDKLDAAAMNVIGEHLIHEAEGRYP